MRLLALREMSVEEISLELGNIPQATLYRRISSLLKAGIIEVKDSFQIRGTVKKIYGLSESGAICNAGDVSHFTPEDHAASFNRFSAILMSEFNEFTENMADEDVNRMGYRQTMLPLSDMELQEFMRKLNSLVKDYSNLPETADRRKYLFSRIVFPESSGNRKNGENK